VGHGGGLGGRGGLGRDEGRLSGPVERVLAEVGRDPVALKMSYPPRAAAKAALLAGLLGPPREGAAHFYEAVLRNAGLKDTHLEGALKFLKDRPAKDRGQAAALLGLLWDAPDEAARRFGLSEDKAARDALTADTLARLERLRAFLKAAPPGARDAGRLRAFARALSFSGAEALELAALKPRLLRGLWKPPRPRWAWPLPVLAAVLLGAFLAERGAPLWVLYAAVLGVALAGTSAVSLLLPIAPGVLRYEPVRRRLRQALAGRWEPSPVVARLKALGVDWEAFARAVRFEDAAAGVRVETRDKRSLEGAAQFLASSEDIGNCIALRHFVSWTLPALLDDEAVMLADVSVRTSKGFQPRGQVWLVAAERGGVPVLCVNSFEFNEAGARDLGTTLPVCVAALKGVCARAGFKALVLGITDFGRAWLDARYLQLPPGEPVVKVHAPELGRLYHFDTFVLRRGRWEYMRRRTPAARAYAVLFGAVELLKGNPGKAAAFLDSAQNVNNCWEVPLS
jgi:hypothetical protein